MPVIRNYPQMNDSCAISFVAITVIIMAYSSLFSVFPILVFYALWLLQVFTKGLLIIRPSRDFMFVLILPILCCLSAFWSDYLSVTIHGGMELVSMVACTVIIARIISARAFVKGITAGVSLALAATIINGNYEMDYLSGTYSLVGLFGSKNQVGFIAEIGVLASVAILLAKMSKPEKIMFSLLPVILCFLALFLSNSATAIITMVMALCLMAVMYMVGRLPQRSRIGVVFISITGIAVIMAIIINIGMPDAVLAQFGKDATLTGRTYLWSEGFKIGMERPFFGHGYCAFWVPGRWQAERYWYEFRIYAKTGFHFHELFVQSFVDLGLIGFIVMLLLILVNFCKTSKLVINNGDDPEFIFLLGVSAMFLIRAFVEVDLLGPFGIGELLFFYVVPRLAARKRNINAAAINK